MNKETKDIENRRTQAHTMTKFIQKTYDTKRSRKPDKETDRSRFKEQLKPLTDCVEHAVQSKGGALALLDELVRRMLVAPLSHGVEMDLNSGD